MSAAFQGFPRGFGADNEPPEPTPSSGGLRTGLFLLFNKSGHIELLEHPDMRRLLLCLWLIGGGFTLSARVFVDAVYFSGLRESRDAPISSSTASITPSPVAPISQSERLEEVAEAARPDSPVPDTWLTPVLAVTYASVDDEKEWDEKEQSERFKSSLFGPSTEEAVRLKVRSAADIRSGPSSRAVIIGTAQTGAELEVVSREAGWVRFVDPATSNTGSDS